MLESIRLKNVGPAPEMTMGLAPRLNLITGDNGLGKTFLLDVAWWALTRTWAREIAIPKPDTKGAISYSYTKRTAGLYSKTSTFNPRQERWSSDPGRPPIPGLILYAQVDGGFSVWDPARNYWKDEAPERPNSFLFDPRQVWEGSEFCEGLIRDWASWQRERSLPFELLASVLRTLSPSEKEPLEAGELRKLTGSDPKRYPTLRMPYGEDVAIIHASAGMRRIVALAYLLIWTWNEHLAAAELRDEKPAREIVFLIDEIEAHLHPRWQRAIAPALLRVVQTLTEDAGASVQIIAATHSPLVLASVEPLFDVDKDAWFDLDLEDHKVALRKREYVPLGEVGNWLVSKAFDLKEPRSLEGERAVRAARDILGAKSPALADIEAAEKQLRGAGLPDIDPFWVRWDYFVQQARKKQSGERP